LKLIFLICFFLINLFATIINANIFELDKLEDPSITTQGESWPFFTEGVMSSLSEVRAKVNKINDIPCYQMTGNVTTENNGGFIQI